MRSLVYTLPIVLLCGCFGPPREGPPAPAPAAAPNIIVILADDMGYSDIGCFGGEIATPHLDRLAAGGVRLTAFYNNARCCPSRAALLTGRYPQQVGVGGMTDIGVSIPAYQGHFHDRTLTVADLLRRRGYATYLSGKWHVGEEPDHWPLAHGFDHCFALIQGAASYYDFLPYRNDRWPPGNGLTVVRDNEPLNLTDSTFYATDLYTDEAMRLLDGHPSPAQPFFLYLSYTAPHWPLHALPEDIARYADTYQEGYEATRRRRYERLLTLGLIDSTTQLAATEATAPDWAALSDPERAEQAQLMAVYAAMVDRLDQNIGRLLDYLEATDRLDNTVIFFLSDNGAATAGDLTGGRYGHPRFDPAAPAGTPLSFTGYGRAWAAVSNTPFRYFKGDTYEGGIATPFIAWSPGRFPGGRTADPATHIVDLLPTISELSGLVPGQQAYPDSLEGLSLLPLLEGTDTLAPRPLFFEHMGNAGVIDGRWKLVRFRNQPWELYDLATDRSETTDLAGRYPERMQLLQALYTDWAAQSGVLPWEVVESAIPYTF